MWLHSRVWPVVLAVGSAVGGWVGDGCLSFPVAFHPLIGMAGLFHMIEEVFQERKNRSCKIS